MISTDPKDQLKSSNIFENLELPISQISLPPLTSRPVPLMTQVSAHFKRIDLHRERGRGKDILGLKLLLAMGCVKLGN